VSAQRPAEHADVRSFRFDQAVMALGVLCGFVFAAPWVIPIFGALHAATAVQGRQAPVPRLWSEVLATRLVLPDASEAAGPWRTQAGLTAALLGAATFVLLVGDEGFAWFFALPAAGLGALAGVGSVCAGCELHARRRRSRRGGPER
jgi:uncharacterized protein DUF4395